MSSGSDVSTPVKKLIGLLTELDSVQGWIVKTAAAGPVLQYLAGWGPPWPENQLGVALGCAVLQVLAAMWALTFWSHRRKVTARRAFATATVCFLGLAACYVYFFARDTRFVSQDDERVVLGRQYQEDMPEFIRQVYGGDLEKALHDLKVDKIYLSDGLTFNRVRLCILFFATYLALSLGMTAFSATGGPDRPPGSDTSSRSARKA
jgi:hypothetical protein